MIHSFEVFLEGADFVSEDSSDADAIFEAGCGDSLPVHNDTAVKLVFDRRAATFATAVSSALLAVEVALPQARILRVERIAPAAEALDAPLARSA